MQAVAYARRRWLLHCMVRLRMALANDLLIAFGCRSLYLPQSTGRALRRFGGLAPTVAEVAILLLASNGRTECWQCALECGTCVAAVYVGSEVGAFKAHATH